MNNPSENLCGPDDLIAKLADHRQGSRNQHPEIYGSISDVGLRQLVRLSYFASQAVEEGRYPKFRLHLPATMNLPSNWQDPWRLARFTEPVVLRSVDDLRRLAPCASSHDFALEIQEVAEGEANRIECCGIRLAHSGEGGTEMFSTSLWARSVRPGLMIRVDGPGELRVSEGNSAWDLRAGKLVHLGSLPTHPLPIWLDSLAKRLAAKEHHEKYIQHTMHFAWNEVLHHASSMRKGGCLIVLPEKNLNATNVEASFGIHLKYATKDVGLGRAVANFVKACQASAGSLDKDQFKGAANQWLRDRYTLLSIVESIGNLSGVDGCTVFDCDLQLVGFGGKISFSNSTETKNLRDDLTKKFLSKDVMTKTGTRHSSAYRLCQGHDKVSCYVVSQDGHVTAFWSVADTIHRWSPYWPWAKRSDHF